MPPPPIDVEAFEAASQAKVARDPKLKQLQAASQVSVIAVATVGAVVLWKAWRSRAERAPAPGPPGGARWHVAEAAAVALATLLAGTMAAGAALAIAFALALGAKRRSLGLELERAPPAAATGARFFLMGFPLFYGVHFAAQAFARARGITRDLNPAAEVFLTSDSTRELAEIVAFALVIAPLTEEIVLRGVLYPAFRTLFGWPAAAVVTAAAFALLHPATDAPAIFCLGVVLALAYERTGSLWAPIATHVVFNAWGIAMLFVDRYIHKAPL